MAGAPRKAAETGEIHADGHIQDFRPGDEIPSANNSTESVTKNGATSPAGRRRSASRPRGPSGERGAVRARIRSAAREEFLERGYDGTTMRSVARRAGCDSAMVGYYFGSKQRLFRESLNLPIDPADEVISVLSGGLDGVAERILHYALSIYEERITGDTMLALMRALITDAQTSQRFRAYFRSDILGKVAAFFGDDADDVGEQIELIMAMMYGIATMRYAVRLEPLASMPEERLVAFMAPIIQSRIDRIVTHLG
jgi:AcrR family transcriptional regulator